MFSMEMGNKSLRNYEYLPIISGNYANGRLKPEKTHRADGINGDRYKKRML